jgi:ATP-dependent RNA helicase RhlE
MTFAQLPLIEPLQRAIVAQNYSSPTPIQSAAIPHLLAGRDLLGCAQTGTGKTAAFALPILQRLATERIGAEPRAPRVLVLSPTRELAVQIGESFRTYGRFLRVRSAVVFGGVGQQTQVNQLQRGLHVLVATPGRLLDLMQQRHVHLGRLTTFVLDEADRMLDMGFLPDLKRIMAKLPIERQSLFFSATLPSHVAGLAAGLLQDPVRVEVAPQSSTVDRIDQRLMFVQQADKRPLLQRLLRDSAVGRTLVFTRTKRGADRVAQQLSRDGFSVDAIHGDKSQNARTRALNGFRSGQIQILVATDVAARGIDVDGITHVINYDMPHEPESYVHRIGRTGRAGAGGTALSFCDAGERPSLHAIEKLIRATIRVDADHPYHAEPTLARKPRLATRTLRSPSRGGGRRRPTRA